MTRLEEVRNQHEAWRAANAIQKKKYDEQKRKLDKALEEHSNSIKEKMHAICSSFNLPLSVFVTPSFCFVSGAQIRIEVQKSNSETAGLRWEYIVSLFASGELSRETNSWSGLQATTQEQVDFLRKSADVFEIFNGLDWVELFNADSIPRWDDYVTEKSSIENEPDFMEEEKRALVEDIIGTGTLVYAEVDNDIGCAWIRVHKDTGKQYQISYIPARYVNAEEGSIVDKALDFWMYREITRISHDKLISGILFPLEILQRNE